jgi:hypothetical protein
MFMSRMLAVTLFSLAAASAAHAANPAAFSVLVSNDAGKPVMFQSTAALKKGDVIKIQSFNAQQVMILQIAMCDSDCPHMHLVKTVSLMPYFLGATDLNRAIVVPEDGHVSFWVQQIGGAASVPIDPQDATPWSLEFVDPIMLSFAEPQLYPTPPMPANALRLNDNTLQARYFHRTFVTVRLADAGT